MANLPMTPDGAPAQQVGQTAPVMTNIAASPVAGAVNNAGNGNNFLLVAALAGAVWYFLVKRKR